MDESNQLEQMALAWPARARSLAVVDQASYDQAGAWRKDIARAKKFLNEVHDKAIHAAYVAHTEALAAKKRFTAPLQEGDDILQRNRLAWAQEQQIKQLQAQREAEAAQEKIEADARLALAIQAEDAKAPEETIEEILSTPMTLPVPVLAPAFQKTQGITSSTRWKAVVYDIRALCRGIADGNVSTDLIEVRQGALNTIASRMQQTMTIPGVRAVPETSEAVRKAV
jgi:hypothetical protein